MSDSHSAKLKTFYKRHGRMPSYRELADLFGFRSVNAATKLVHKLIEQGLIAKDTTGRLIPRRLFGDTRLLGSIEAGFPSAAEEELADTVTLDDFLIGNRDATFMLKVRGESMKNAGILDGDMVLVERGRQPRPGDIVIAEVDHDWTMKYYRKVGNRVYLEAANPAYPRIEPKNEMNIAAVVVAVVRKYRR